MKERRNAWAAAVIALTIVVGTLLTYLAWKQHDRFGTFGFDAGIFAQGTWLLSQLEAPFVTIRGLNLLGDHASYILVLLAPLYAVFPTVKLLLLLQAFALVVPAVFIFLVGRDRAGEFPAAAVAVAYLIYPTINHAALWQFHPETLASGFLAAAAYCAVRERYRWMAAALVMATLCKEDVSLVVAGFGLYLASTGVRKLGIAVVLGGATYFVVATFIFIRIVNGGEGSIYTARLYGIEGDGFGAVVAAAPTLLWNAVATAASSDGVEYLSLIFVPFLMLSLLAPRWLLAISGPMLLNLASTTDYQRNIEFQYLVTSAPFVGLAAVHGMAAVEGIRWRTAVSALLVVVASAMAFSHGPIPSQVAAASRPLPPTDVDRQAALRMIPDDAAVSAQANTVTHLANRKEIYEFPNPFRPSNWGRRDEPVAPDVRDRVRYVLVDPHSLQPKDFETLRTLEEDPEWETLYNQQVVLLRRR